MQPRSVIVAIPALNEEFTLPDVIAATRQSVPDARVLVIDDGSTDRTAEVAQRSGVEILQLPFNVGVGGAMRTAFLFALQQGADAVVQVDADGQHNPADIPLLLEHLSDASVVVGARFAGVGEYPVHPLRGFAMRLLATVLSRISGQVLTDTTSGFRAVDREAIRLFAHHYPAEYLGDTVESLVIAMRAGLRVTQVPVAMMPRQDGQPSTGPVRSALYLGRAVLALVTAVWGTSSGAKVGT